MWDNNVSFWMMLARNKRYIHNCLIYRWNIKKHARNQQVAKGNRNDVIDKSSKLNLLAWRRKWMGKILVTLKWTLIVGVQYMHESITNSIVIHDISIKIRYNFFLILEGKFCNIIQRNGVNSKHYCKTLRLESRMFCLQCCENCSWYYLDNSRKNKNSNQQNKHKIRD